MAGYEAIGQSRRPPRLVAAACVAAVVVFAAVARPSSLRVTSLDATAGVVFVSATGDDAAAGTSASPVRTLAKALELRRSKGPGVIQLASGSFRTGGLQRLGPEDAGTIIQGNGSTVLSGGAAVPDGCWRRLGTQKDGVDRYACDLRSAASSEALRTRERVRFRSLAIDGVRGTPARFPNRKDDYADATQFLYVSDAYEFDDEWYFTVAFAEGAEDAALPAWLDAPDWTGGRAMVWPSESWNNYEGALRRPADAIRRRLAGIEVDLSNGTTSLLESSTWFQLSCPLPSISADSGCDGDDTKLKTGARLYVFSATAALDAVGEWHHDEANDALYVATREGDGPPSNVVVPLAAGLFELMPGADGVEFRGVTFADADYDSFGFQDDFDVMVSSVGIPKDAAVRVRGARDVTVADCNFAELGGGGVLFTDSASGGVVAGNSFTSLGQTAVMLVGNATTQPSGISITSNAILRVGETLASSSGVFCCSCVSTYIFDNDIRESSRWGVAIRSQDIEGANSGNNTVSHNRITTTGTATKDYGAISLIAYSDAPKSESVISHNRVVDAVGVYSSYAEADDGSGDLVGALLTKYMSYGIYLDNYASGYTVHDNVIAETGTAGIFFHLGWENRVVNNVFFESLDAKYEDGAAQIVAEAEDDAKMNNTFERNVVAFRRTPTRALVHADDYLDTLFSVVDRNTYYVYGENSDQFFFHNDGLTTIGNWSVWTSSGFDTHSTVAADPLFVDADALDLCLDDASPAYAAGFTRIPDAVCRGPATAR